MAQSELVSGIVNVILSHCHQKVPEMFNSFSISIIGLTPLHYSCMGGFMASTQLLLQARASVRSKDLTDKAPLHYAGKT